MLQALVARLGTPDVHFLGHVSNEELTALYDVADLFLCASEHEGFCVPLIEAFYKRVPVLAYAATAVPATMDGGGVLYDTKDPFEIARADGRGPRRRATSRTRSSRRRTRRSTRLLAQGLRRHAAALRRPDAAPRRRAPAPEVAWDFWRSVRPVRAARGAAAVPAGAVSGAAAEPRCRGRELGADPRPRLRLGIAPMIDQPVGAGRPSRRRDRRQRAARARHAARHGPRVRALRADDRRRPARRRAAVRRSGGARAATSRSSTSRCRRR